MSAWLKELDLYTSKKSTNVLPETLNVALGEKNVFHFVTLNGVSMYGMYDPKRTRVKNMIQTFFNNY